MYHGNDKIRDTTTHGVYVGDIPINHIYHGTDKVYQYHPYEPGTEIFKVTGADSQKSRTISLSKGIYAFAITGGGGNKNQYWDPTVTIVLSDGGGSGASWEGTIKIDTDDTEVVLYAGGANEASYLNINGDRIITAGDGKNGGAYGSAGQGGTLATDFGDFEYNASVSTDGNRGAHQAGTLNAAGGASTSTYKWGGGITLQNDAVQVGGFRLSYVGDIY